MVVTEEGYAYIFVSNENPTKVDIHFDDLKVTHVKSNVIQYNEYYPFGLQTSASWTRESTKDNNYLYNAANELNKTSGWYEMYYRGYDPAIGRMLQVDPYASMYASSTTYNYALNNPVMMNDPSGGQAYGGMNESWRHPSWGTQRTGAGSGNNWTEGIGGEGWSLDGANSAGGYFGWVEYTHTYTDRDGTVTVWYTYAKEWIEDPDCPKCPKGLVTQKEIAADATKAVDINGRGMALKKAQAEREFLSTLVDLAGFVHRGTSTNFRGKTFLLPKGISALSMLISINKAMNLLNAGDKNGAWLELGKAGLGTVLGSEMTAFQAFVSVGKAGSGEAAMLSLQESMKYFRLAREYDRLGYPDKADDARNYALRQYNAAYKTANSILYDE